MKVNRLNSWAAMCIAEIRYTRLKSNLGRLDGKQWEFIKYVLFNSKRTIIGAFKLGSV